MEEYKGLVFQDINDHITYTIYFREFFYQPGVNIGRCIFGILPDYDGTYDLLVETYQIHENTIIYLIQNTYQKKYNYDNMVEKEDDNSSGWD